jgi:hypothetical protein
VRRWQGSSSSRGRGRDSTGRPLSQGLGPGVRRRRRRPGCRALGLRRRPAASSSRRVTSDSDGDHDSEHRDSILAITVTRDCHRDGPSYCGSKPADDCHTERHRAAAVAANRSGPLACPQNNPEQPATGPAALAHWQADLLRLQAT